MCCLGEVKEIITVPKEKALKGYRYFDETTISFNKETAVMAPYWSVEWVRKGINKAKGRISKNSQYGFWSFKNSSARYRHGGSFDFTATILLWGTIAVHELGYRSKYAEIVNLHKTNNRTF